MPIYEITAPDGKTYEIEGPPGASRQDVINAVLARNPAAGQAPAAPAAPKEGIMAALAGGAKRFGSTIETGLESAIDPNLAAQRGVARSQALGQEYAPGASLEKVKQAYAEKGLFPAAYEAISQIPTAISENVPNIAATLAGGRTGAMAGSAFGPVGALVGGGIGAVAPSLLQLYGSGLERQAQEGSKDVSRTAALGAAIPGAAAEVVSTYIPLGRTFIGKLLGPEAEKALARGTNQSLETAAKESVMATLAKGTAIGAGVEIPTEVGQQMLERLQAGLPLTTPDALKEYGESAYGAALVGGPFGAAARAAGRPGAREQYQALKQKEEQAAFDAERKAALDKFAAEEAEAEKQRGITREQLGEGSNLLALPAPSKEVKPTDETRELINPVGDITREELAPEVTKYIDTYRKDNGLPRLKSYTVEDVKDAMTQVNPKGEQAALDSILTAKTGYTGEERYTAENVLDAAVEKNVATETKGFNDFLARVTGTNTLDTMTQPQLFAAFKALKDMKREDTTQQLVLPEGSNASRYTQRQYDQALDYVRSTFEESGNKPLSTETILTDIKDSTKLETERDAMALLNAAIKNEDLSQSREVVFRTYREGQARPVATYRDKAKAQAAAKKQGLNVKEEALVQVAPAEQKVAPETKRAPLPTGYEIKESLLESGKAPAEFEITPEGRGKRLTAVPTEGEATAKIPKLQALRAQRAAQMDANIAKSEGAISKGQAQLDRLEADGKGDSEQYKILQAKQASRVKTMNSRIELFKRQKEEFLAPLKSKAAGQKTLTRQAFTVSKDGKTVGSFPSRKAAEESILTNLPDEELAKVASDTRFGGITDRAVREQERRKEGKKGIEVTGTAEGLEKAGVQTTELKEKLKVLEDKLTPMLAKFGLKDVALNVVRSIERNAEGSYIDKLIKIAMDAENPIRTMRHEALHALKELGFFTPEQWKALEKQAKNVWIDKYLGGQMAKVGDQVMTRLEAYKQMGLSEAEIMEEAIADAFGDFDTAGKAPPGMLQALFKRMQQFFTALRQALGGAGFESAEEIFGKIERGELEPKKVDTKEAEEAFKGEKLSVRAAGLWMQSGKTIKDVIDEMDLTPDEFEATSLMYQTGKAGTEQFKENKIGGLPEVVQFLQDERRKSGLPLLDINKEEDRKIVAKLMATEALAAIRSGGANLEWYDSIINKTLAMAGLKYPELNTDINARMAFKVGTAITSQGLNVEDNLAFAMKVYDQFRKNGKFPEIGQGADQSAMISNFKLANYLLDDMKPNLMRQFLETEFTVEELRSAGFNIGGELGDEKVLGSSVFGPKIGFGFYSNLNGNFDPVTMDMWFMRTIGRLTGKLKAFRQDLYDAQLDKFRNELDTEGGNGVFANQFDQNEIDLARVDDEAAEALARKVKSAHERDFKNNRAEYDAGTRGKSKLVAASETMIKSLDAPKDAPANGTERRHLRDVVRKMVDIVEEKYGKRVPPASLQAVIWYPEQELYKALGVKLRVTSQNYAGAIEKILTGEGYGETNLRAAAKLGSRTAQQLAKSAVSKGAKATGEEPVRLGALKAEEKETLLERGRKRVVLEEEKVTPKRKRVIFEVAPDPNNKALTDKWRALSNETRIKISERIGNAIIKSALAEFGLKGYVDTQVGSYLDDTNPSFALYLDSGDSVAVAKFLGYVLSQDSMMVVSAKEGNGLDKTGAVRINIGDATNEEVDSIYQKLRQIEVDGEKPVGGQSYMNGHMVVLNYSNVSTDKLASLINEKLNDRYEVITENVYTAFPEKKDYDYANPSSDPKGNAGVLRQAGRDLRAEATRLLQKELRGIKPEARPEEKLSLRTPETKGFKNWVGKNPIIPADDTSKYKGGSAVFQAFHGTTYSNITVFDPERGSQLGALGAGPYFSTSAKDASVNYAGIGPDLKLRIELLADNLEDDFNYNFEDSKQRLQEYFDDNDIKVDVNDLDPKAAKFEDNSPDKYFEKASKYLAAKQLKGDSDGLVMPVYIKLEKPFDMTSKKIEFMYDPDSEGSEVDDFGRLIKEVRVLADQMQVDPAKALDAIYDKSDGMTARELRDIIKDKISLYDDPYTGEPSSSNQFMQYLARELGYDGIIQNASDEYYTMVGVERSRDPSANRTFHIMPFTSQQVKSATGNSGVFDPTNKDIRYSLHTFFPTAEAAEKAAYKKAPPTTAEFKRFFGGSTIKEEGRAVPMFHASPSEFDVFRENKPIFISPSASEAEFFGRFHYAGSKREKGKVNVYPLWVRAETPFDFENEQQVDLVYGDLFAQLGEFAGTRERMESGDWSYIEDPAVLSTIKKLGFDSFYVKEGGIKNLAVFNANQVKSITGNIGDYSLDTKDMRFSLKTVRYSDERFEKLWDGSYYTQNGAENKTKGYLAFVNPMDFVLATATPDDFKRLRKEQEPLDFEKMKNYSGGVPYLSVSEKDGKWKITGHEGRHRMLALNEAGYREVPVYIEFKADNAESIPVKMLTAQYSDSMSPYLMAAEVEPLSYANKKKAMEKFTRMGSKVKYSLPPISSGAEDRVNTTTTVREQDGFVGRMLQAISPESRSYFRQQALNRYNQLGVYDKKLAEKMGGAALLADQSAESAALMSDLGAGITASAMGFGNRMGGIPVYKNGVTTVINNGEQKGLIAALAPLAKYNDPKVYQYYQYWAAVKRGERLYAEGREQLIQPGDRKYADELLQKFPEFEQVQKDFNEFNKGLVQYMVDTGVLSEAQGKEYVKYADYVPFYRQLNEEKTIGPNIFQAISGVKQPRKLKGGEAPLADFLETVVRNTQASIQAGIKNAAAQRAVNVAMQLGSDVGAERLTAVSSAPDTVTVLEKGEQVTYRVADPLFISAIKSLNIPELPFMTLLSAPSNTLRNLVTKDPGFMMANLMRDSLSAWVTSGQNIKPIIGTVQNFAKALAGRSPGLEALLNAGVVGGYEFSNVVEASAEELAKDMRRKYGSSTTTEKVLRPFTWVWEALEKGTEASDAATRIAVYERVMEETGNEAEALYRALEVMNFNRKGSSAVIRILTAAVPFLNARMQGLDVFYRAAFGQMATKDAKAIQKAFWVRGMTMMALSSMYFFAVSDDEEYKKQEAETKDNYWIIPGVGKFPTPFEVGVLFKTIPERILAYSFKDDTGQDFKKSIQRALVNTFAFNPIPQTVKPIIEASTNYSFFTMRPIVGQGMEKVAPEFQVGPGTSKLAEMIGTELGLSPIKIDSIIRGYTGTIGMYGVQAIDAVLNANSDSPNASKRFEQLPVIKRFALDPEARGNITQYYELKNAVDSLAATSSLLEKSMKPDEWIEYMRENKGLFATTEYVRDLEKEMKELREMRRLVQTGPFSADSKRDYLTTIGQAENNLTKNIQTVKKLIASYQ